MNCQSCGSSKYFQTYYVSQQPCTPTKYPLHAYGSLYDVSSNFEDVAAATNNITDSQIVTYDVPGPLKNVGLHRNTNGILD